eukprot:gnl/TRDRNA2_/TRDRNA2_80545_c0_seq1.p1 gnl/TRDRNA2_/TRDRNA2_80545_c0~~gnl/TRDRNA2_/TRDRNA2_80545_c0_seq1.p1  ORF type:complete len:510 (-),score=74.28 gnl/TRDRNA2_/TRDRNA2_80545_c0_seq1:42-1571(-)
MLARSLLVRACCGGSVDFTVRHRQHADLDSAILGKGLPEATATLQTLPERREFIPGVDAVSLHSSAEFASQVGNSTRESVAKKRHKVQVPFNWSKAEFAHFAMKIAYLGTNYHGLCKSDNLSSAFPTVEGELFKALTKTHLARDRESCGFEYCGGTDAGVHAAGNYVSLHLRVKPPSQGPDDYDYPSVLNSVLPNDIRVVAVVRVPAGFSARLNCRCRIYKYYFALNGEDLVRMHEAAQHFVGLHDFRNFCKLNLERWPTFERRIFSASVRSLQRNSKAAEIEVRGNAFLWHQVRCMAEILMLVGRGLEEPSIVAELLDIRKHPCKPYYKKADPSGLVLYDCQFEGLDLQRFNGYSFNSSLASSSKPSSARVAVPASVSHRAKGEPAETFRTMQLQLHRKLAVTACLLAASANEVDVEAASRSASRSSAPRHIPLLQRPANAPVSEQQRRKILDLRQSRKLVPARPSQLNSGSALPKMVLLTPSDNRPRNAEEQHPPEVDEVRRPLCEH